MPSDEERKLCSYNLKPVKNGTVKIEQEESKEVNRQLDVSKEENKQQMILDAGEANLHFITLPDPEFPPLRYLLQFLLNFREELWMGNWVLTLSIFCLTLWFHMRNYFTLPPVLLEERRFWPRFSQSSRGGRIQLSSHIKSIGRSMLLVPDEMKRKKYDVGREEYAWHVILKDT